MVCAGVFGGCWCVLLLFGGCCCLECCVLVLCIVGVGVLYDW